LRAGPGCQPGPPAANRCSTATLTVDQAVAANIAGLQHPYAPEFATNYEIGAKTSWFDNRLIVNASLYREDFTDLQVLVGISPEPGVIIKQAGNAGRTRSQGLDLEIHAVPAPWLHLGIIYSYSDDKFLTNVANYGNVGNYLPDTPKNALNVSAEGHWSLPGEGGTVSAGGDITFRSKVYSGGFFNRDAPQVLDNTRVKGLLNGSIDFKMRDGRWDFRLWGKNLTDTHYGTENSALIAIAPAFGYTGTYFAEMQWNMPRTFGVTATYHLQ
jgi:iron complex outermembrane receptor protein